MKKGTSLLIAGLFVFGGLRAESHYKYIHARDTDVYFGHVIYPAAQNDGKDAVVLREGRSQPEVADLNLPLVPGDKIITGERRCEMQFDTGTIIRLDRNSELKIETILARSLSSKIGLTNMLLNRGQAYVMYKRYIRKEVFQVITPNAAVKLDHKSVAIIHVKPEGDTDVLIKEGKGHMLYGPNENAIRTDSVKKSQMVTITPNHGMVRGEFETTGEFEEWNTKINEDFMDLHEGKAVLPKPIQRLPDSIFYFAQKYGSRYGEWLWDSYLGYVWRPFLNDRTYPSGSRWTPYYNGRWSSVQGQLFWVPSEVWGWVPYHLGIWMWTKSKGWVWIPGSVFAPAWVDWAYQGGYFCWRAWSVTDWYAYAVSRDGYFPYFAHLIHPDDDPMLPDGASSQGMDPVLYVLSKNQLKSKKSAPLPMPDELKETYKRVVTALKNGEDGIFTPLKETPNHMFVVSQNDLNSPKIHEKIVKLTSFVEEKDTGFLFRKSQQNPYRQAKQTFNRNAKISSLREKVSHLIADLKGMKSLEFQEFQKSKVVAEPMRRQEEDRNIPENRSQNGLIRVDKAFQDLERSVNVVPVPYNARQSGRLGLGSLKTGHSKSRFRYRDWNPDAKVAREYGMTILYSSSSNEVRCPDLNISSKQVGRSAGSGGARVRLTSSGSAAFSGGSGGSRVAVYGGSTSSGSLSKGSLSKSSSSSDSGSKNSSSSSSSGSRAKVVKKQL